MKRYLLIISIIFLMTGCSIDYKGTVYSKNRITENIKINFNNDELGNNKSLIKKNLKQEVKKLQNNSDLKGYKIKSKYNKKGSSITFLNNYSSLTNFSNSNFWETLFENITVIENKEYNLFQTTGEYFYYNIYGMVSEGEQHPEESDVSNVIITMQFANKIIEHNADKINEKNNTFTWILEPTDYTKGIYFKYSHQKDYVVLLKMMILDNLIIIIIILLLGLLTMFSLIYFIFKNIFENIT